MSHYYGDIRAAFHGKAGDLRKLAPLVWQKEALETLKADLAIDPSIKDDAVLTLSAQLFYEDIDLCDEKIRPEGWDFWLEDPDTPEFMDPEDLKEKMKPFQAVMLKGNPKTGEISRVLDYQPGGPLPAGVRMEEKERQRFYLDDEGNDYFLLSEIPIEEFYFDRTVKLFQDRPDYPDWLREWYR